MEEAGSVSLVRGGGVIGEFGWRRGGWLGGQETDLPAPLGPRRMTFAR